MAIQKEQFLRRKPMRSHKDNTRLLNQRIEKGQLDQYFSLNNESMKQLAQAVKDGDYDEMANLMINNITSGGQGIEPIFTGAYDSQIEEQANRLIRDFVREIEVEAIESFREEDVEAIRNLTNEIRTLPDVPEFISRKRNILKQLEIAERKLAIPENLEKYAVELVRRKNKNVENIRITKVIQRFGRYGKRALVTWGKRGFLAFEYLEKSLPKGKKPKLEYIPTQEEWIGKTPVQILSRKGQDFTIKERMFVMARKRKSEEEVISDYQRIFGKVRPESEIKKLIGDFR